MEVSLKTLLDKYYESDGLVFMFMPTSDLILLDISTDPSELEASSRLEVFKRLSFAKILDHCEFIGLL
jgi:hypothetical protein